MHLHFHILEKFYILHLHLRIYQNISRFLILNSKHELISHLHFQVLTNTKCHIYFSHLHICVFLLFFFVFCFLFFVEILLNICISRLLFATSTKICTRGCFTKVLLFVYSSFKAKKNRTFSTACLVIACIFCLLCISYSLIRDHFHHFCPSQTFYSFFVIIYFVFLLLA